jgi:hypothetical protein
VIQGISPPLQPPIPRVFQGLPLFEDVQERFLRVSRQQPQGVAVHVDLPGEVVESVLVACEGIFCIQPEGIIFAQLEFQDVSTYGYSGCLMGF